MAGRKPKPTHLKVLNGNPGKRALNKDEPKPTGELKKAPDWFNETQKDYWNYAIENAPGGLLKKLDKDVLIVYVCAAVTHKEASLAMAQSDLLTMTPNGMEIQNPLIGIINKQATLMLKAAGEMGFTPSSRSRIAVPPTGESKNPFDF